MQQPPGYPPGGGGGYGGYGPPPGGGGYGPPPGGGGYGPPPGPPGGGGYGPPPGGGGYGPPPGPPGYGAPPGPPPMGPPKKDGPNIALIIVLVLGVLAATGLGGCLICVYIGGRSASGSSGGSSGGSSDTGGASTWITSDKPYVKFQSPPGWNKNLKGDWGVFKSPDGNAVFAFTTFDQPGESTAKLGNAAWALGVSDVSWGSAQAGTVGRDNFAARMGEGSCNFGGPGGYIWYATVNSGTPDQILLIYTVSARGNKSHKDAALTSIRSLQRR